MKWEIRSILPRVRKLNIPLNNLNNIIVNTSEPTKQVNSPWLSILYKFDYMLKQIKDFVVFRNDISF